MPTDMLEAELQGDGSLEDAVLAMPDIEAEERARGEEIPDDPLGKTEPKVDAKAEKTEKAETKPEADDEADWIEFPPEEEGKEASRVKLDDIVAGWKQAQDLRQELETVKASPKIEWLPHEVEAEISKTVSERSNLINALQQWQQINAPKPPDENLLNPQSVTYNPELYWSQKQQFQQNVAAFQAQKAKQDEAIDTLDAKSKQELAAVEASRLNRERSALVKAIPEITAPGYAQKMREYAKASLKLDDATLDSVTDHRFYVALHKAMAYDALQNKQAEAVKVVRAKPKLVQGQARSSQNPNKTRFDDAYARLKSSGSLEDAADAIGALI